jgi:hypothetical protein
MKNNITQNDLLRYMYNEDITAEEKHHIDYALKNNWELKYQYDAMQQILDVLNLFDMRPPHPSSVKVVMRHNNNGKNKPQELETLY